MLLQCRPSAGSLSLLSQKLPTAHQHSKKHKRKCLTLIRLRKPSGSVLTSALLRDGFLEEIAQLSQNKVVVAAGVSAAIGQLSKPFTSVIIYGKELNFKAAFQAGGFPSSHSSAVVASATALGLERGLSDSIFGLAVVYAALVMYDSQGVRKEVGNHAKVINKALQAKPQGQSAVACKDPDYAADSQPRNVASASVNNFRGCCPVSPGKVTNAPLLVKPDEDEQTATSGLAADLQGSRNAIEGQTPLKESVGHTQVEVAAGALLGFTVSMTLYNLI